MSRVQFVETVTVSGGPAGTLLPVVGIAATPYIVNPDGSEGSQVTAYVDRTSLVSPTSLATDATGTISFWLDAGDYNVHMDDQQSPPRIQSYVRGFTAPIIDNTQFIVAAQNLIQFTGDTKFSLQPSDHGLKPDGTYEWLLVSSDVDGGGRKVDHTLYPGIHQILGSPTPDSLGMIRLPNLSGRALIASGAATGLTRRNLLDLIGEETHKTVTSEMPAHDHVLHNGSTGVTVDQHGTGVTAGTSSDNAINSPLYYAGICTDNNVYSGSMGSGQNGAAPWGCSAHAVGWVPSQLPHSHNVNITDPQHNHTVTDNGHGHTLDQTGGGVGAAIGDSVAHNNIQPSAGFNLFVKS